MSKHKKRTIKSNSHIRSYSPKFIIALLIFIVLLSLATLGKIDTEIFSSANIFLAALISN